MRISKFSAKLLGTTFIAAATLFGFSTVSPSNASDAEHGLNIMPNYYYEISTIRKPGAKKGDFTLRLRSPAAMSGCIDIEPPTTETLDAGSILFITLHDGAVFNKNKPRYAQFECKPKAGQNHVDLDFNTHELQKNEVYRIDIRGKEVGGLFDIRVKPENNKVTLITKLQTNLNVSGISKEKNIEHWFYPQNTVVVCAHGMKDDPEIKRHVDMLAQSRGLKPLEDVLKGFSSPEETLYFVDRTNALKDGFEEKETVTLGSISLPQTFNGPRGEYQRYAAQTVYARKPGLTD